VSASLSSQMKTNQIIRKWKLKEKELIGLGFGNRQFQISN